VRFVTTKRDIGALALTAAFPGFMHLWSEEVLSELAGHFEFFLNGP